MNTRDYERGVPATNIVHDKLDNEVLAIRSALLSHPEHDQLERTLDAMVYRLKLAHHALGASGEAGEIAGKVKKLIRDVELGPGMDERRRQDMISEVGDVLWYLVSILNLLGASLEDAMGLNHAKLAKRMAEGKIVGDGDRR